MNDGQYSRDLIVEFLAYSSPSFFIVDEVYNQNNVKIGFDAVTNPTVITDIKKFDDGYYIVECVMAYVNINGQSFSRRISNIVRKKCEDDQLVEIALQLKRNNEVDIIHIGGALKTLQRLRTMMSSTPVRVKKASA